mgnify:CR=1 FL=1
MPKDFVASLAAMPAEIIQVSLTAGHFIRTTNAGRTWWLAVPNQGIPPIAFTVAGALLSVRIG